MKKRNRRTENKRRQRRFLKHCNTYCTVNNNAFEGISCNFSISGLFLKTSRPLKENEIVDIVINLPDGSISKIKGRVIRSAQVSRSTEREKKIIRKKISRLQKEIEEKGLAVKAGERISIEIKALERALAIQDALEARDQNISEGIGIEILEKDANYLHLIRGCLLDI